MSAPAVPYSDLLQQKEHVIHDAGPRVEEGQVHERLFPFQRDIVLSPFAGIGSELYVALKHGRRAVGIELKPEYWEVGVRNVKGAVSQQSLFEG